MCWRALPAVRTSLGTSPIPACRRDMRPSTSRTSAGTLYVDLRRPATLQQRRCVRSRTRHRHASSITNGEFQQRVVIFGGDPGLAVGARHRPGRLWRASTARLLVGNFGDGRIHAYDPPSPAALLRHAHGRDQQSDRDRGALGAARRQRREWRRSRQSLFHCRSRRAKPAASSEAWPAPGAAPSAVPEPATFG